MGDRVLGLLRQLRLGLISKGRARDEQQQRQRGDGRNAQRGIASTRPASGSRSGRALRELANVPFSILPHVALSASPGRLEDADMDRSQRPHAVRPDSTKRRTTRVFHKRARGRAVRNAGNRGTASPSASAESEGRHAEQERDCIGRRVRRRRRLPSSFGAVVDVVVEDRSCGVTCRPRRACSTSGASACVGRVGVLLGLLLVARSREDRSTAPSAAAGIQPPPGSGSHRRAPASSAASSGDRRSSSRAGKMPPSGVSSSLSLPSWGGAILAAPGEASGRLRCRRSRGIRRPGRHRLIRGPARHRLTLVVVVGALGIVVVVAVGPSPASTLAGAAAIACVRARRDGPSRNALTGYPHTGDHATRNGFDPTGRAGLDALHPGVGALTSGSILLDVLAPLLGLVFVTARRCFRARMHFAIGMLFESPLREGRRREGQTQKSNQRRFEIREAIRTEVPPESTCSPCSGRIGQSGSRLDGRFRGRVAFRGDPWDRDSPGPITVRRRPIVATVVDSLSLCRLCSAARPELRDPPGI